MSDLSERLSALEAEVRELRARVDGVTAKPSQTVCQFEQTMQKMADTLNLSREGSIEKSDAGGGV